MLSAAQILAKLAGDTKALMLISEYRLGRLHQAEMQDLMAALANSDLERIGIIELVRRLAPGLGLEARQIDSLLQILAATQLTPPPLPLAPAVPTPQAETETHLSAWESKTIRMAKSDAPNAPSQLQIRVNDTVRHRRNPSAAPPPEPPPKPTTPPRSETFYGSSVTSTAIHRMSERKVLLADDDNRIRMVFRKRLEDNGFLVEEAVSGEEAWQKMQENHFALIVMDMKMPGVHGLELLARFNTMDEKPAVVVCSAYEQLKDDFVVKNYPRLRFLVKPVPADNLLAAINELLLASP